MPRRDSQSVELECRILHETPNAIKVEIHGEEIWFPLSTVDEIHRSDPAVIRVAEWIAKSKGLL